MLLYYCYYCKLTKHEDSFTTSQRRFHAGRNVGRCKECSSIINKSWRTNNPDKVKEAITKRRQDPLNKERDRLRSYPRRYGISKEEYLQLKKEQYSKCAICGKHEDENISRWGVLCLDHNHVTGQIRKLLCASCNKGLGCFKDNYILLIKASEYLRSFK